MVNSLGSTGILHMYGEKFSYAVDTDIGYTRLCGVFLLLFDTFRPFFVNEVVTKLFFIWPLLHLDTNPLLPSMQSRQYTHNNSMFLATSHCVTRQLYMYMHDKF